MPSALRADAVMGQGGSAEACFKLRWLELEWRQGINKRERLETPNGGAPIHQQSTVRPGLLT